MSKSRFSDWMMAILARTTAPATYYDEALKLARRISDPEEEYALLLALAEVQLQDDGEAAVSSYKEALIKAQDLGDPAKELPCLIGLIKVLGFTERDAVAGYKARARDILDRLGKLEQYRLRAYLVNDLYCIPPAVVRGERYRLMITQGEVPAGSLRLFDEPPGNEITPDVELIYNLGRPDLTAPKKEPEGICVSVMPRRLSYPEIFTGEAGASGEAPAPGSGTDSTVKPEAEVSLPAGPRGGLELSGEGTGPAEGQPTPRAAAGATFDLDISLKGIGLECNETNLRKTVPCQADSILFSTWITPLGAEVGKVDIRIVADGIPYGLAVSYLIEESRPKEGFLAEWGVVTGRIQEIRDRLNVLFDEKFPERAPSWNVFMEAAAGLKDLAAQLPLEIYPDIIRQLLSGGKNGDLYSAAYMLRWRPEAALAPPLMTAVSAGKYRGTVVWQALDAVHTVITDPQAAELLRRYEKDWSFSCWNFLIKQAREHPTHPSYTGDPFAPAVVWGKIRQISEVFALPAPEIFGFKNSLGMALVPLPAGTFAMGSPAAEPDPDDDAQQHQVTLSRPFYLQTTPVTQGQWRRLMDNNPSDFRDCGDDCPVETVSWDDAQEFITKLNRLEETETYRLPTEAEWEYACRAGSTTSFCFGDDPEKLKDYAWYYENSERKTRPVGQKQPNAWGLYDLHGNVWEWCRDWYGAYPTGPVTDPQGPESGRSRVLRGGSWNGYYSRSLRSAVRSNHDPVGRNDDFGFRVARTL